MKRIFMAFLIAFVASNYLFSDQKITLAVLDVESQDVPSIITNAISDIVRSEFTNIGNFSVVEREEMDEIIEEQRLILSGMVSEDSAVKIGELLSAQKIVLGELNPLGEEYILILRIIDVETGQSEYSTRENSTLEDIDKTAESSARTLAQLFVTGYKEYFTALSPSDYYLRSIVPGWGQFYADRDVEGAVFMSLNALSLAAVAASGVYYVKTSSDYHNLPANTAQDKFDSSYDEWQQATDYLNYSLIAFGSTYLLHWVDVLFFAKPDFKGDSESIAETAVTPWISPEGQLGLAMTLSY